MKKITLLVLVLTYCTTYAQKKSNGTIYIEHPAITVVEAMSNAFAVGDSDKVASFLTDDFKAFNGVSINKNSKGQDKSAFSKTAKDWFDALDYFSIKRSEGAYPDALEYKDENQKNVIWVQTWEDIKGVHKKTGVKIDMPMHRLFIVTKDNKIKTIITYTNSSVGDEIGQSMSDRKNGTIFNHHENINTIRKMMYAFENKDYEKAYAFYDTNAKFSDINAPVGTEIGIDEMKANDKKLFEKFELTRIDMVGYPDYLHYEMGDQGAVMSWWNLNLIRKSDKKAVVLPLHLIDNFDKDGKIVYELMYYSAKLLD
jgi:hypothetical protein